MKNCLFSVSSNSYYSTTNHNTTELKEIPKSGIYVYGLNGGIYKPRFYKLVDGNFVNATDYKYFGHHGVNHHATFFPYEQGVYYAIERNNENSGEIYLAYGSVLENGGRLPNLFPCRAYQYYERNNKEEICFESYGKLITYGKFFGSILRLQDVEKIVAAPPYSIFCRIYEVNDDLKKIIYIGDIYAATTNYGQSTGIAGVSLIDFSELEINGRKLSEIKNAYIYLCINKDVNEYTPNKYTSSYMGMMNLFGNIQSSIFVKWKNNVNVTYDSGIPSVVKNNINVITENIFAPDMK